MNRSTPQQTATLPPSPEQFSESVTRLREDLVFSARSRRGKSYFVIEDPDSNRFCSVGEAEYRFIGFLDGVRSNADAHRLFLSQTSHSDFNFEQAEKLIAFLEHEKLLASIDGKSQAKPTPPEKRLISNVNPIGFRLRLFEADSLAKSLTRFATWLRQPLITLMGIMLLIWGTIIAFTQFDQLLADSRVLIQPTNWFWLSVCWVLLKVVHESAHAATCRYHGGKVGDAGINFLLVLPMPFVDVTSSWRFSSHWRRIEVAVAGMVAELIIAAIFLILWSFEPGPALKTLSIQVVLMASLSTILFNANPLMRFDGYFILSDLIHRPNLAPNAMVYQKSCLKWLLFGIIPERSLKSFDLPTKIYGWLAAAWRVVIAIGILFAAANFFHGLGIILAGLAILIWYIKPAISFLKNSTGEQKVYSIDKLHFSKALAVILLVIVTLAIAPWPFAPSAVGVVQYANDHSIKTCSDGFLNTIHVQDGHRVQQDQILAELSNDTLTYKLESLRIDLAISELSARELKKSGDVPSFQAESKNRESIRERIRILQTQLDNLTIRAPCDGVVAAQDIENLVGSFIKQGTELLKVLPDDKLSVVACVTEFDAPLFEDGIGNSVKIKFANGESALSAVERFEPKATRHVLHDSLSAEYGGPLAVRPRAEKSDSSNQSEWVTPMFITHTSELPDSLEGGIRPGLRCEIHLQKHSRSCLMTIRSCVSNWLRTNWNAASSAAGN